MYNAEEDDSNLFPSYDNRRGRAGRPLTTTTTTGRRRTSSSYSPPSRRQSSKPRYSIQEEAPQRPRQQWIPARSAAAAATQPIYPITFDPRLRSRGRSDGRYNDDADKNYPSSSSFPSSSSRSIAAAAAADDFDDPLYYGMDDEDLSWFPASSSNGGFQKNNNGEDQEEEEEDDNVPAAIADWLLHSDIASRYGAGSRGAAAAASAASTGLDSGRGSGRRIPREVKYLVNNAGDREREKEEEEKAGADVVKRPKEERREKTKEETEKKERVNTHRVKRGTKRHAPTGDKSGEKDKDEGVDEEDILRKMKLRMGMSKNMLLAEPLKSFESDKNASSLSSSLSSSSSSSSSSEVDIIFLTFWTFPDPVENCLLRTIQKRLTSSKTKNEGKKGQSFEGIVDDCMTQLSMTGNRRPMKKRRRRSLSDFIDNNDNNVGQSVLKTDNIYDPNKPFVEDDDDTDGKNHDSTGRLRLSDEDAIESTGRWRRAASRRRLDDHIPTKDELRFRNPFAIEMGELTVRRLRLRCSCDDKPNESGKTKQCPKILSP